MNASDVRHGRLVVNALSLRPGGDAARTFLENVLRRLPDAWPGPIDVLVRGGVELPPDLRLQLVEIGRVRSGASRLLEEHLLLPRRIAALEPAVLLNPNESLPPRIRVPIVVVAQNLLWHCPGGGPVPAGPLRARLRSRAQAAFYRRAMPRAYARADVVACVSRQAADVLERRAGLVPRKTRIVPCGADRLPVLERRAGEVPRTLIAVGAVAHYKRLDVAIRALAALDDSYELALVGDVWPGQERAIGALAHELGIASRVRLLGTVADEALAELYAGAHACVALSACESFGIPVVEAMRAGVPVVGADADWLEELAGDAVRRVEPEPRAVAAAIRELEDDREWHARSGSGRRAAEQYTWARTAAGLAEAAAEAIRIGASR